MFKIAENILEIFFPSRCAICDRLGYAVCPDCGKKIVKVESQVCPGCNKISKKGVFCVRCRRETDLNSLISVGYLKDPILKEIIHVYKYEKISSLAPFLSELLISEVKRHNLNYDFIFFAPLNKKRRSWRGFNQAELLAKSLAKELELEVGILEKVKDTKTQVGLTKKERQKNVMGVFRLKEPKDLTGKKVLIVDDVLTTGTTLSECAKVLKKAGAGSVHGAVMAKE